MNLFFQNPDRRVAMLINPRFETEEREYIQLRAILWIGYVAFVAILGIFCRLSEYNLALVACCAIASFIVSRIFLAAYQKDFGCDLDTIAWWRDLKLSFRGDLFRGVPVNYNYSSLKYWIGMTLPGSHQERDQISGSLDLHLLQEEVQDRLDTCPSRIMD